MGLRELAEKHLAQTLENDVYGFAHSVTVTSPSKEQRTLKAITTDIGALIDPDTGQLAQGRFAEVNFRNSSLLAEFDKLPSAISDESKNPWLVSFDNINGVSGTFKVVQVFPDAELGVHKCVIGGYSP